jgi:hypothetical protein
MADLFDELFDNEDEDKYKTAPASEDYIGGMEYRQVTEHRINPTQAPFRANGKMIGEWDPEYM